MGVRTTAAAVRGLLGDNYNRRTQVEPYIAVANGIVNQLLAAYPDTDADTLEMLERILSCHYYQKMDKGHASRGGVSFESRTDMYLTSSQYGQMAIEYDPTGFLALMNTQATAGGTPVAGGFWLGTPNRQGRTYEERQ